MQDYPARILTYTKEKLEVNLSLISRNILSLHKRWICRNSFCLTFMMKRSQSKSRKFICFFLELA